MTKKVTENNVEEAEVVEEVEAQAAPAEDQQPTFNLQDLATVLQLLNVAIKRGVYEPKELATVGSAYGKLEDFLTWQANQQKAAADAASAAAEGGK